MLTEKAVVVTGSGRGIGRACAIAIADRGSAVVVNDVDRSEAEAVANEINERGGIAIANAEDVADWDAAGRLIETCVQAFGTIDGLVNNAAIFQSLSVLDADEAAWRRTISVNVLGVAFCLRHAAAAMVERGVGAIVNVSSGGHHGVLDAAPYGTSKGAVASLTYCAAIDLADTGVRVNGICPRAMTRMADIEAVHAARVGRPPVFVDAPAPEDNALLVAYLLSDAAADLNGQMFRVEGDGLGMVSHPVIVSPTAVLDKRDDVAVARGFDTVLRRQIQPLGIHYAELNYV
jgi:NAD(P)-dependent dehydrogenase (short-subunit alcohol dehydrogenase family)